MTEDFLFFCVSNIKHKTVSARTGLLTYPLVTYSTAYTHIKMLNKVKVKWKPKLLFQKMNKHIRPHKVF